MSDNINMDQAEELQELDRLEEITADAEPPTPALLSYRYVTMQQKSNARSPSPTMLLDKKLNIQWVNESFKALYGSQAAAVGRQLSNFFTQEIKDSRHGNLIQGITSPKSGFSWLGRVEKKSRDRLSVIANLLILPIFDSPETGTLPVGYMGILDNISAELRQMLRTTYESLLGAARLKDNDTGNHIERVNRYARKMAQSLLGIDEYPEVDREFIETIGFLAAMHDIGKIGTPDDILNKEGPLEAWEWEIMQEHTLNGAFIMSSYPNPMAKEIALRHHERWDGSGYPHDLSENLIPLSARLVAIGDVYDALRMKRSYKQPFNHQEAQKIIIKDSGSHFDPSLVEYFIELENDFYRIYEELKDP
ncbi:MAG TPA: HD domain-containing protein [Spirochaetales bacterium]|nr:HD domain-containing protein [Spirochaetales bacterium]